MEAELPKYKQRIVELVNKYSNISTFFSTNGRIRIFDHPNHNDHINHYQKHFNPQLSPKPKQSFPMHPELFHFHVPGFLQGILPETLTIYSYGFLIAMGAILAFSYTAYESQKQFKIPPYQMADLGILLLLAAFVGGKVLFYLENPDKYLAEPALMFKNLGKGFVFYGSLLFCIPTMLWFFRKHKLPVLPMLDIMAVTTCIVHILGRLGCFQAGCCYGLPSDGPLAVTFTHAKALAKPLGTPLHPTQLYDAGQIFIILMILLWLKPRKKFDGQVFLVYLFLYAIGRSIVEIFRGDVQRGFVIEDILSHSQFIAVLMMAAVVYFYRKLSVNTR